MQNDNKKYILLGLSLLYDQMVHERLRSEDENTRVYCLEESNKILMLIKDIEENGLIDNDSIDDFLINYNVNNYYNNRNDNNGGKLIL
jgi:hypothetical protein